MFECFSNFQGNSNLARISNQCDVLMMYENAVDMMIERNVTDSMIITEATSIINKSSSILRKIMDSISQLISFIVEKIADIINLYNDKYLTSDDLINSDYAQQTMFYDIEQMTREHDKLISKGQQLLRKLLGNTPLSTIEMDAYGKSVDHVLSSTVKATVALATSIVAIKGAKSIIGKWKSAGGDMGNIIKFLDKAKLNDAKKVVQSKVSSQANQISMLISKLVNRQKVYVSKAQEKIQGIINSKKSK